MSYLNIRAPFNKRKVDSAEELWSTFMDYAKHSDEKPVVEPKLFNGKDGLRHGDLNKIRPYTLNGLCNFIGMSPGTWDSWKKQEKDKLQEEGAEPSFFLEVILQIESIIYDQQYQGAAVDIFNTSIVSRKLGLAEKRDVSVVETAFVKDIGDDMTPAEAAELYEQTLHPNES